MTKSADIDLIEHAAAIIDGEAMLLRYSHTIGKKQDDWNGARDARRIYDNWKRTVARLYKLADRMREKK